MILSGILPRAKFHYLFSLYYIMASLQTKAAKLQSYLRLCNSNKVQDTFCEYILSSK